MIQSSYENLRNVHDLCRKDLWQHIHHVYKRVRTSQRIGHQTGHEVGALFLSDIFSAHIHNEAASARCTHTPWNTNRHELHTQSPTYTPQYTHMQAWRSQRDMPSDPEKKKERKLNSNKQL